MNPEPEIFKNERALASAGSGKTYTLTNRFIALCLNTPPERICALTFTRKSAAEFLDKILNKLSAASSDENAARELSKNIEDLCGCNSLSKNDFLRILDRVAKSLPKLRLGTIDSFCAGLVKSFAPELGLFGKTEILDSFGFENAVRTAVESVFESMGSSDSVMKNFAETLKRASYGKDDKAAFENVYSYVKNWRGLWLKYPDISVWGNEALFGGHLEEFNERDYLDCVEALRALDEPNFASVVKYFDSSRPGSAPSANSKIFSALAQNWRENKGKLKDATYPFRNKTVRVSPRAQELFGRLIGALLNGEIKASCRAARAVGEILKACEDMYEAASVRKGKMDFSDMPRLLSAPENRFAKNLVEYRLDSRTDHWLFDEFQDTSRQQWGVFENLIDEILQNPDGNNRTFYYVGDVKQSIYGWRGGDPELFDEIFKKYSKRIAAAKPMNVSYRSVPCVIESVNGLFGSDEILAPHFAAQARKKWFGVWGRHVSKFDLKPRSEFSPVQTAGCVALVERSCDADDETEFSEIYEIISRINPRARGLSCAVLVQSNLQAERIINSLRARKKENKNASFPPISGDLDRNIVSDNPTCCALRALVKLMAHPLDTAAREYVLMTPLRGFVGAGFERIDALRAKVFSEGFEALIADGTEFLTEGGFAEDEFTRGRLGQMRLVSRLFDMQGLRDADMFVRVLDSGSLRESSASGTVQVMTIHKSKGLDFDVVILPELGKGKSGSSFELVEFGGGKTVMRPPCDTLSEFSYPLFEAMRARAEREDFESLCKFYVACTRAKRAVYFVRTLSKQEAKGKAASSPENPDSDFSKLVRDYFDCAGAKEFSKNAAIRFDKYSDENWFEKIPFEKADGSRKSAGGHALSEAEKDALSIAYTEHLFGNFKDALKPSAAPCAEDLKSSAFARAVGTIVHSALEKACVAASKEEAKQICMDAVDSSRESESVLRDAKNLLRSFFDSEEMFEIFRPTADCQIRCEHPFFAEINGREVSGVFDRLEISSGSSGAPEKARIVDFKTDSESLSADDLLARHSAQMSLYKSSAAKLLGIGEDCVECVLLSVRGKFAVKA